MPTKHLAEDTVINQILRIQQMQDRLSYTQKAVQTCEQALTILHIKCNSLLVLYTLSFPARALSEPKWGCHITGELVRQPSKMHGFLEAQISRKE